MEDGGQTTVGDETPGGQTVFPFFALFPFLRLRSVGEKHYLTQSHGATTVRIEVFFASLCLRVSLFRREGLAIDVVEVRRGRIPVHRSRASYPLRPLRWDEFSPRRDS